MNDTRLSIDRGPLLPALRGETIGAALADTAARFADRPALIVPHQSVHLTWAELQQRADAIAAGLLELGLEHGDRIGIWAPNCAEWTLTQFASAKIGLILVNINPAYRLAELHFALNRVACAALILAPRVKHGDYLAMMQELAPELADAAPGDLHARALPHLRTVVRLGTTRTPGMFNFEQLPGLARSGYSAALERIASRLAPEDPINIQFTSGTTGSPKGAVLTHYNILNNGHLVGAALGLAAADRVCIPVPLYHCFGMVMGNLACLAHGAAMVYPSETFDAGAVLAAVSAQRCTALYGVPTMFIAELDHPQFGATDFSSLRTGIMAGSPCPVHVMQRVLEDMHMPEMTIAYGMTETSPVATQSSRDDSLERRVSTVGRVHPHLEIKLIDAGGGLVPRGTAGEFCTRGYSLMHGYWDDPVRTRAAIDADGWMHTGDLATMDADGYVNIVGRLKDMIIRGGENIYPREIEEFLYTHRKIREAHVVGVPDPKYGEEICAWLRLHAGETASAEEIREFCRTHIAHFKVPRYVRFVEEFPMTVSGKVRKFAIRAAMIEELRLSAPKTA